MNSMKGSNNLMLLLSALCLSLAAGNVRGGEMQDGLDQNQNEKNNKNRGLQLSNSFRAFQAPFFGNGGINRQNECTYDPNQFNSNLIVEFLGQPDEIGAAEIKILEETFTEVFNDVAGGLCDPTFRTVGEVTITNSEVFITRRNLQNIRNMTRPARRFSFSLYVLGNCRRCQKDAPLFNDAFRRLQEVEGGDRDLQGLNGATFNGAFTDHRPIDLPSNSYDFFFKNPFNCDCEKTGEGDPRGVKTDEFNSQYSGKISGLNLAGILPSVEKSLGVFEVVQINCTDSFDDFDSEIIVDATGDPENITTRELSLLRDLFLNSYKVTSEDVCDTEFRVLISATVEVVEVGSGRVRRTLYADEDGSEEDSDRDLRTSSLVGQDTFATLNRAVTPTGAVSADGSTSAPTPALPPAVNNAPRFRPFRFRFRVSGKCKGCKSSSRLFNDAFRRRRVKVESEVFVDNRSHRNLGFIVNNETCYCAVNSEQGLPEADTFTTTLDTAIQEEQTNPLSEQLPNVGAIIEVIQVDENMPSSSPSAMPSISPSQAPSNPPSERPSAMPSQNPSTMPTVTGSAMPSPQPPSNRPSEAPSRPTIPTESPVPSPSPSVMPSPA